MLNEIKNLSQDSIYKEMEKAILKGTNIIQALDFLMDSGLMEIQFPAVYDLMCSQHSHIHHAEGDVWEHTKMVVNVIMNENSHRSDDEKIILFFSALFHDIGKPSTLAWNEKKKDWTNYKHADVSAEMVKTILASSGIPKRFHQAIIELVENHMVDVSITDKKIKQKAEDFKSANWDLLMSLRIADGLGRMDTTQGVDVRMQENRDLVDRIRSLGVLFGKLPQLIHGKDLIELGMTPGKDIGSLIAEIRNLHIAGQINTSDDALAHAQKRVKNILEKSCLLPDSIVI